MFRKLHWHLSIKYITIFTLALLGLGYYLSFKLDQYHMSELNAGMAGHGSLLKRALETRMSLDGSSDLSFVDEICKQFGYRISEHIMVYNASDQLIGDSEHALIQPNALRYKADTERLQKGFGCRVCHSELLSNEFTTYSTKVFYKGNQVATVRVQSSLASVKRASGEVKRVIISAILLTILILSISNTFLAKSISKPIGTMNDIAKKIACGEIKQRISFQFKDSGIDEIDQLAESLNQMALNLQNNMDRIAQERNKLETILSEMADGIIVTDSRGHVILFNPASERIFGKSSAEIIGSYLDNGIFTTELSRMLAATLATGKTYRRELKFHSPVNRSIVTYVAPVRDEDSQVTGSVAVLQDQTEVRKLAQIRRDFVANVSHELRTPVASIRALSETLMNGAKDDPEVSDKFIRNLYKESERLSDLIKDILDIAKIDSGKKKVERTKFQLAEMVLDVVTKYDLRAREKQIDVKVNIPDEIILNADRVQMEQVFTNLLDNAVKYNHSGGRVAVDAGEDSKNIIINIEDSGIGISKADVSRIFERFYRADKARSREFGGTGLGLAIVKDLVESHGGIIDVKSELGIGSTFIVSLPKDKNT